jgi:hypothetical protein
LVRLVSGAERPTSGEINRMMSVSWPLAFGGAFQNTLTGLDNVRFISRIYRQHAKDNIDLRLRIYRTGRILARTGSELLVRHARTFGIRYIYDYRIRLLSYR